MNKCLQHLNLLHIHVSQYLASDSYGEGHLEWSVAGSGSVLRVQGRADPSPHHLDIPLILLV